MTEQKYPPGWDEDRVKRLIAAQEGVSEDEQAADDDAAAEGRSGRTVIAVPDELLPAIRHLLATHKPA